MRRRRNYKLFKELLGKYDIQKFYHFTDKSNIPSIIENGGLFSWASCENNHIKIARSGGSELSRLLDTKSGVEDYVRISLCKYHPMMFSALSDGRITDPVILEIDTDILYIDGNIFSNKNAVRSDAHKGSEYEDFALIHFATTQNKSQFDVSELEREYFQAEILVKNHIPLHYITNISYNYSEIQDLIFQNSIQLNHYSLTPTSSKLIVFLLNQTISGNNDNTRDIIFETVINELKRLFLKDIEKQYDIAILGYGDYAYSILKGRHISPLSSLFINVDSELRVNYECVSIENYDSLLHKGLLLASNEVHNWTINHPKSSPPVIIHISPHGYSDSNHASIIELSRKIKSYHTDIGNALLFNIIPSNTTDDSVVFPTSISEVGDYLFGEMYYLMSSYLPEYNKIQSGNISNKLKVGMAFKIEFSKLGDTIWDVLKQTDNNL